MRYLTTRLLAFALAALITPIDCFSWEMVKTGHHALSADGISGAKGRSSMPSGFTRKASLAKAFLPIGEIAASTSLLMKRSVVEISAADYGLTCDSSSNSDIGPALNRILADVAAVAGNASTTVHLPRTFSPAGTLEAPYNGQEQPFCSLKTTIQAPTNWSNIDLEGAGGGGSFAYAGTRIKWTGAAGGTMLNWTSPRFLTVGSKIRRLWLDGNDLAGIGVLSQGLNGSEMKDVQITHTTKDGMVVDSIKSPGGVTLGRYVPGSGYNNNAAATYTDVVLADTAGLCQGVRATVGVAAGAVDSVLITSRGSGCPVDSVLRAPALGGAFAVITADTDTMKAVGTFGTGNSMQLNGGTGLTNGTYRNVGLKAVANPTAHEVTAAGGTSAIANIVVSGGVVTFLDIISTSSDWPAWTTFSVPIASIGGTGTAPLWQTNGTSGPVSTADWANNTIDNLVIRQDDAASSDSNGFRIGTGSPWIDVNTSRLTMRVAHKNGIAFDCHNADGLLVVQLVTDSGGGVGHYAAGKADSVVLNGGSQPGPKGFLESCRDNHFDVLQAIQGLYVSQGGAADPPFGNDASKYLFESGAPNPYFDPAIRDPSASFVYGDDLQRLIGYSYAGSALNISGPAYLATGVNQSGVVPSQVGSFGLAETWNYFGDQGENDFWNQYFNQPFSIKFSFLSKSDPHRFGQDLFDFGGNGDGSTYNVNMSHLPLAAPLHTPASSTAHCTAGEFLDDQNYHYVCIATNRWKRARLSDF